METKTGTKSGEKSSLRGLLKQAAVYCLDNGLAVIDLDGASGMRFTGHDMTIEDNLFLGQLVDAVNEIEPDIVKQKEENRKIAEELASTDLYKALK